MKRHLMMASALLLLASCAPSLVGVGGVGGVVKDVGGTALQVAQGESATLRNTPGAVVFTNPGPDTAQLPTVLLSGDARTEDKRCKILGSGRIGCELADVPAGADPIFIKYTGTLRGGSVTFYRPSKPTPGVYLRLQ